MDHFLIWLEYFIWQHVRTLTGYTLKYNNRAIKLVASLSLTYQKHLFTYDADFILNFTIFERTSTVFRTSFANFKVLS